MLNKIVSLLMLAGFLGALAACNTIDGMGKDIERAGEATSETAQDVKRKM
jgi:entericidin B